jgi:hypothetical protein
MIEWCVLGRKSHAQLQFVAFDLALANDEELLPWTWNKARQLVPAAAA